MGSRFPSPLALCRTGLIFGGLLAPAAAHATAQELFGFLPRDLALAGAAEVLGDQGGEIYYDPAAMAEAPRMRLQVGYLATDPELFIDGEKESAALPLHSLSLALVLPVPLKGALADRLAIGLALEQPTDRLVRIYSLPPTEPQLVLLQNDSQVMGLYLAGSIRLHRDWSVGGGVRLGTDLNARALVTGNAQGVTQTVDGVLTSTFTPYYSVRWAPTTAPWRAALTWREASRSRFDAPTTVDLGGVPYSLSGLTATTLFVPAQAVLGVGRVFPHAWLEVDLAWERWSDFPDPSLESAQIPATAAPFPAFHDTVSPRVGLERRISGGRWEWTLRLGYRLEPSPVPQAEGLYQFLDNDRHLLGAGAGWSIPWRQGHLRIDLGTETQFLVPRVEGDDLVRAPWGAPLSRSHASSGRIFAASLGIGWEY